MRRFVLADKRTGEVTFEGVEANKNQPCWVCEHTHKVPSWCLVDADRQICICQRISSKHKVGDAGWWHSKDQSSVVAQVYYRPVELPPDKDWSPEWALAVTRSNAAHKDRLAEELGIPAEQLNQSVEIGWAGRGWAFKMTNTQGVCCGIKLRLEGGGKLCEIGSRLGLVFNRNYTAKGELVITEGESDMVVANIWGFNSAGRPSCSSCSAQISEISKGRDVILAADRDDAGIVGAQRLKRSIEKRAKSCTIVVPPEGNKDLRSWYLSGEGTAERFKWLVKSSRGY